MKKGGTIVWVELKKKKEEKGLGVKLQESDLSVCLIMAPSFKESGLFIRILSSSSPY